MQHLHKVMVKLMSRVTLVIRALNARESNTHVTPPQTWRHSSRIVIGVPRMRKSLRIFFIWHGKVLSSYEARFYINQNFNNNHISEWGCKTLAVNMLVRDPMRLVLSRHMRGHEVGVKYLVPTEEYRVYHKKKVKTTMPKYFHSGLCKVIFCIDVGYTRHVWEEQAVQLPW